MCGVHGAWEHGHAHGLAHLTPLSAALLRVQQSQNHSLGPGKGFPSYADAGTGHPSYGDDDDDLGATIPRVQHPQRNALGPGKGFPSYADAGAGHPSYGDDGDDHGAPGLWVICFRDATSCSGGDHARDLGSHDGPSAGQSSLDSAERMVPLFRRCLQRPAHPTFPSARMLRHPAGPRLAEALGL